VAVKIRLKRMGKIRAPFYRIVVADARTKRDGRVIEEIGKYNPKLEPSLIEVDSERALHWLSVGAQPSEPVLALLRKTGDWQKYKGEPAPEPLKEQVVKSPKLDVFNEALKEAHGDTAPDAVSARQPRKKAAAAAPAEAPEPAAATPDAEAATAPAPAAEDAATAESAATPEPAAPAESAAPADAAGAEPVATPDPLAPPADETPEVAAVAAEEAADEASDAEQKNKAED
jgi:small subunit ribosomal protein S16